MLYCFILKRICHVDVQRQLLTYSPVHNKHNKGMFLFAITLVVVLISSVTLSLFTLNAQAQEYPETTTTTSDQKPVFRVIVQVTNNANTDAVSTVHVYIDGTEYSKVLNGAVCPAKSTVSYTFDFDSEDVPVGKGFTAEMVYGDDIFKRASGVNSPSKTPETVQLTIP